MSATVTPIRRPQPQSQAARLEASAAPTVEQLTQPQIAALRQALHSLQHLATLAGSIRAALQSHGITELDRHTDAIRADAGMAAERIYRMVSERGESKLDHVRADALELREETARAINA